MKRIAILALALMLLGLTAFAESSSGGFLDGVAQVNNAVNGVVWGVPALVLSLIHI